MSALSRKQKKFIDKLFYHEQALREAVKEMRVAVVASAADSADPTARQAVETIADIKEVMGIKQPEAWLRVVDQTWLRYHAEHHIGKAMRRRYQQKQSTETISIYEYTTVPTVWRWREEFLTYAALVAFKSGLTI